MPRKNKEVKTVELLITGQYRAKLLEWFNNGRNVVEMARDLQCRQPKVSQALKLIVGEKAFSNRYSKKLSVQKIAELNPKHGSVGLHCHNFKGLASDNKGYLTIRKPTWWTGTAKSGRIYWHHFVYATVNFKTEIPKGFVIHHIDCDKSNNIPSNLHLCSVSDYSKLHKQIAKGVTTIPEGSSCKCGEAPLT